VKMGLAVLVISLVASNPALAIGPGSIDWAACRSGDAPPAWSGNNCKPADSEYAVCKTYDTGRATCETIGTHYYGLASQITIVTHYGSSSMTYSAWGTMEDGYDFCCIWNEDLGGEVSSIWLNGNTEDDSLAAQYGSYSLYNPGGSALSLYLEGYNGDDVLTGPRFDPFHSGLSVQEYGQLGADILTSDLPAEFLGGANNDVIIGSNFADIIVGDDSTGVQGADAVSGYAGADVVHVGGGNDDVCGGDDADELYGGDNDDRLWGGTGIDVVSGGAGTNHCGDSSDTQSGCSFPPLTGPPYACP